MRKIKFRGKDSDNGKWRYGFYIQHEKVTLLGGTDEERKENTEHYIVYDCFSDWNMPRKMYRADVDGKTVGQYTGMKDCNGTEIYEGDIVSTDDEDEELSTIEWGDDTLKFMVTHGNVCSDMGEYYPREIEVMGNIYDNPELLGGADDEH